MRISDWSSDVCSSDLFDAGGYDLVMARGRVTRHIQFKTKIVGGKTDEVKISLKLMEKPSGCVLWIVVTPDLVFDHYLWFGAGPGESLPDISAFAVAKHSKGTAQGAKNARPGHLKVRIARFEKVATLDARLLRWFGDLKVAKAD